ncbi:MAG: hypothetical protein KF795_32370 [Labilithrix sp.]|nr:hypothetical protein [Labilithrix sp.]
MVEAPMVEADASAAAVALAVGASAHPAEGDAYGLPFRPGDRWTGTYLCRQGSTHMTIAFEDVRRASRSEDDSFEVDVIFEFRFDGDGRPGFAAAEGVARMRGSYDARSRRLRLKGDEWIEQPPGYALVDLVGSVSKTATYSGSVEGPGCSSFSARPEDAERPEKPGSVPLPARSLRPPRP